MSEAAGRQSEEDATSEPLLAALLVARDLQETAARGELLTLAAWARANSLPETAPAGPEFGDRAVAVAGQGAPTVSELAIVELAALLGCSAQSATDRVGAAVELAERLPAVYARVMAGEVATWRGRKIAEATTSLPAAAVSHVDVVVAERAHSISGRAVRRVVEAARLQFDPAEAQRRRAEAAEHRHVDVHLEHSDAGGVVGCEGILDLDDALALEAAIRRGAEALAAAGCTDSLDVRRAKALGNLARGITPGVAADPPGIGSGIGVDVVVHVAHPSVARCGTTTSPITVDQVRSWVHQSARVRIMPVLDLAEPKATEAYEIPDQLARQVRLRDEQCVFPYCTRRSERCDLDHITSYARGGPTSTDNLAPLCRRHHRAKTHGRFRYQRIGATTYRWRLPSGVELIRDRYGTRPIISTPGTESDPGSRAPDRSERAADAEAVADRDDADGGGGGTPRDGP